MTNRLHDDDEYFVKNRTGVWTVVSPFGKGWRMYRNDQVIRYLRPEFPGGFGIFFAIIGIIAFVAALLKDQYAWASLVGLYFAGLPILSIRSTLETTFLQIEDGRLQTDREGKAFAPISAARRHFLKAQTTQIGMLIGLCTFMGGALAAAMS